MEVQIIKAEVKLESYLLTSKIKVGQVITIGIFSFIVRHIVDNEILIMDYLKDKNNLNSVSTMNVFGKQSSVFAIPIKLILEDTITTHVVVADTIDFKHVVEQSLFDKQNG